MLGYIDAFGAPAWCRFPFAAALVFFLTLTHLDAKRVIVDDTETDKIIYSPNGWKNWMSSVHSHYGKTNVSTSPAFFTFTFTGISAEVEYHQWYLAKVNYSIDDTNGTATGPQGTGINQTLFREEGLANVQHALRVEVLSPYDLYFSRIIYDDGNVVPGSVPSPTDIPSGSSGSSPNIGAIVGGAVAGVVVCVALIYSLIRWGIPGFLRCKPKANSTASTQDAKTSEHPGGLDFLIVPRNSGPPPPN